jgi:peptidoglycan hydrolase CwlO-like protein
LQVRLNDTEKELKTMQGNLTLQTSTLVSLRQERDAGDTAHENQLKELQSHIEDLNPSLEQLQAEFQSEKSERDCELELGNKLNGQQSQVEHLNTFLERLQVQLQLEREEPDREGDIH